MEKKRHHTVPKFYLRSFSSAPRRVHLLPLASGRAVRDASLRDQCYTHRFYGPTDELEDELAVIEGEAASVIREICKSRAAPVRGSEAHAALLVFVCLQLLRTPTARQQIKDGIGKVDEQIFGGRELDPDSAVQPFGAIDDAQALFLQLQHLPSFVESLDDLALHVANTGPKARLVTSDNPFRKYNTYCKGIRYWGSLGGACRGLQIFAPLSPGILLVLYDESVYKLDSGRRRNLSVRGVRQVNALQLVGAEHCVYFSNWQDAERIRREAKIHRPGDRIQVVEVNKGPLVGRGEDTSIVHSWEQMPELRLSLPFSRIRLQARQTPLKERVNTYRRP